MKRNAGYTLLELMIVVGLIAIATIFAIPAYLSYVQRADRSTVQGDLMSNAAALERYKTQNFGYTGADAANVTLTSSPSTPGAAAKYNIALTITGSGAGYEMKATSTSAFDKSKNEVLKIDNTGKRCISAMGASVTDCTYGTDKGW